MTEIHAHSHDHHQHEREHHSGWRAGVAAAFTSALPLHSHDSADSVDSALRGSSQGIRAVKISLAVLGVTALLQLLVVAASGSVALLADSVHNVADALTAVPLWIAFALSRRAASRRYTYGFGRVEDLAGLFVIAMIALSAVVAGWQAISRLVNPTPVEHLGWVAVAGIIGFAGNELVALYRIRVGRRIGSGALVADGLHARADGLTSLAVVLGAAARDVFRRLLDGVDPTLVDTAERALLDTDGVLGVRHVQLRWLGHTLRAEADVEVDPRITAARAHQIAHRAEAHLFARVARLEHATIHTSPAGTHAVAP